MSFDVPIDGPLPVGPSSLSTKHLPFDDRSVKEVRDEVATTLRQAGWSSEAVERARVVASELATNALVHGESAFDLEVRLENDTGRVWIGVKDEAPYALPAYADRDIVRPGGMGLYLVDALAVSWGVQPAARGKVVWACLADEGRMHRGTTGPR
jgi:anti-sigma regulatory factor (Ser/Thr protein kinase)